MIKMIVINIKDLIELWLWWGYNPQFNVYVIRDYSDATSLSILDNKIKFFDNYDGKILMKLKQYFTNITINIAFHIL